MNALTVEEFAEQVWTEKKNKTEWLIESIVNEKCLSQTTQTPNTSNPKSNPKKK